VIPEKRKYKIVITTNSATITTMMMANILLTFFRVRKFTKGLSKMANIVAYTIGMIISWPMYMMDTKAKTLTNISADLA
jgi:hypothetical protein